MSDTGALSDSNDRLFTCSNDPISGLPNSLVNDTRNQSGGIHSSMTMDFSGSEMDLPPISNRLNMSRCDEDPDDNEHLKQLTLQVPGQNSSCRTSPIQSLDRASPSFFLPSKQQQQPQSIAHANTPPASLLGASAGVSDTRCRSAQGLIHLSPPVKEVKTMNSLAYCSPDPNTNPMCNPHSLPQSGMNGSIGMLGPVGDRVFGAQNLKRGFGPASNSMSSTTNVAASSGQGPPNVSEFLSLSGTSSSPGQSLVTQPQPLVPSPTQQHSLAATSSAYSSNANNANNSTLLLDSVNSLLMNDPSQSSALPTISLHSDTFGSAPQMLLSHSSPNSSYSESPTARYLNSNTNGTSNNSSNSSNNNSTTNNSSQERVSPLLSRRPTSSFVLRTTMLDNSQTTGRTVSPNPTCRDTDQLGLGPKYLAVPNMVPRVPMVSGMSQIQQQPVGGVGTPSIGDNAPGMLLHPSPHAGMFPADGTRTDTNTLKKDLMDDNSFGMLLDSQSLAGNYHHPVPLTKKPISTGAGTVVTTVANTTFGQFPEDRSESTVGLRELSPVGLISGGGVAGKPPQTTTGPATTNSGKSVSPQSASPSELDGGSDMVYSRPLSHNNIGLRPNANPRALFSDHHLDRFPLNSGSDRCLSGMIQDTAMHRLGDSNRFGVLDTSNTPLKRLRHTW